MDLFLHAVYMILIILILVLLLLLVTYRDVQTMKAYQKRARAQAQAQAAQNANDRMPPKHPMPPLPHVYPWWHSGFPHGGFRVGPWTWSRKQHYYHPLIGWY